MEDSKLKDKKLCECGCGELIPIINKRGDVARFKHGHHMKGAGHWIWKGGRYRNFEGYIYVRKPEHPYATYEGYVFEHRLIMEEHVGRYLVPNIDDVHHINGIKDDNRLENLQLLKHGQHTILTHSKDLSNVKCSVCQKSRTHIKKNGRPMWYHNGDKKSKENLLCRRCYYKLRTLRLEYSQ